MKEARNEALIPGMSEDSWAMGELQPKELHFEDMTGADLDAIAGDCTKYASFGHYCATAERIAPLYPSASLVMALVFSGGYADYDQFRKKVPLSSLRQMIAQMWANEDSRLLDILNPQEMTGSQIDELSDFLKSPPPANESCGYYYATAHRVAPEYHPSVVVKAMMLSYGFASYDDFRVKVAFGGLRQRIQVMVEKNKDFFGNLPPMKTSGTEEASLSKTGGEAGPAASAS